MHKKYSFTLLTLVTFFILGFSITANAEKLKLPQDQLINSAPLNGIFFTCNVSNMTDSDIDVTVMFTDRNGAVDEEIMTISAGQSRQNGKLPDSADLMHCTIAWWGMKGDIVASFCTHGASGGWSNAVCFELD